MFDADCKKKKVSVKHSLLFLIVPIPSLRNPARDTSTWKQDASFIPLLVVLITCTSDLEPLLASVTSSYPLEVMFAAARSAFSIGARNGARIAPNARR